MGVLLEEGWCFLGGGRGLGLLWTRGYVALRVGVFPACIFLGEGGGKLLKMD